MKRKISGEKSLDSKTDNDTEPDPMAEEAREVMESFDEGIDFSEVLEKIDLNFEKYSGQTPDRTEDYFSMQKERDDDSLKGKGNPEYFQQLLERYRKAEYSKSKD